jgi:ubiquinol-cytochrome c reductase cytochrome c subunit
MARSVAGAVLAVAGLTWLGALSPADAATSTDAPDPVLSRSYDTGVSELRDRTRRQVDLGGDPEAGAALYVEGCASCHGAEGQGIPGRGPTLEQSGPAAAHFYLTSGRMPAAAGTGHQALRKPPAYDPDEIADLVAFVSTLGEGPPIPEIDVEGADLALGQQLYTANCAGCHNSAGSGGALGQGNHAPAVTRATDLEVAEAIRVGPGAMPAFSEGVLDDDEVNAIVRFVGELRDPESPGGFALGRIGPVTEGMVAWLVGMVLLVLAIRWIGSRE